MSNLPMPLPRRKRSSWWLVLVLFIVLLSIGIGAWVLQGPGEPGVRTQIAWPGTSGPASALAGGFLLGISPELRAEGVKAELGAGMGSSEQTLFILRKESKQEVVITAGGQPLRA